MGLIRKALLNPYLVVVARLVASAGLLLEVIDAELALRRAEAVAAHTRAQFELLPAVGADPLQALEDAGR